MNLVVHGILCFGSVLSLSESLNGLSKAYVVAQPTVAELCSGTNSHQTMP